MPHGDCELQEVIVPSAAQCLLEAEQEEGTGTALQDASPPNTERDGIMAHLDTESIPKGAK
jgi:hypothetical protein